MTLWEFLKSAKWTSTIGMAIILTALIAIAYAKFSGEGDEGFMRAKDGKVLKLNRAHLPITCIYHKSAMSELINYELARHEINNALGFTVFAPCNPWMLQEPFPSRPLASGILLYAGVPPEEDPKDNTVTVASPFDDKHGGSTLVYQDRQTKFIYGSIIYIDPELSDDDAKKAWVHELGHAMGLDHDRIKGSIMFPVLSDRNTSLTGRDIRRLKEAYAPDPK